MSSLWLLKGNSWTSSFLQESSLSDRVTTCAGVGGVTVICMIGKPLVEVRPTTVGQEGEIETVESSSVLSLLRGNLENEWQA